MHPPSENGVTELVPLKGHVCLPGEPVLLVQPNAVVAIGGGLRPLAQPSSSAVADAAAVHDVTDVFLAEYCAPLQRSTHHLHTHVPRYTVTTPASRRYSPRPGDPIIAVIARKVSQHYYYCYIGGAALAYMDAVAFDGATKVSRPRVSEGDLVYCYVKPRTTAAYVDGAAAAGSSGTAASAGGEVEVACTAADVGLPPKDWTSGEAVFGPLHGGRVLTLPLPYVRRLLAPLPASASGDAPQRKRARVEGSGADELPASYLLQLLGRRVPFEVAVGLNGLVWVRGLSSEADATVAARRTVAVSACIAEAQYDVTQAEMEARVEAYFPS
ncbi:putative exosome complex exonuclease RRP40 [Leptomonas pyrrhocoris]|uniref:Putative exosome complex exonuclease RRP40 n=1 Tax=Leptomonas pyrrhocoris TaxID=157538 RepID=A0A0M9FP29_LEPPY|nr:putative exosome complex exonuclease RRP40 [Leptomonas pyrrhocoris]KPA73175.1 putative exosome complex exonuclease RRP40 [Leptomonas pyrrhocoris]|eukprot:XP_015651614.1 putative exosome complex exonuclease RRP40 [Leptomonas pyrrhocoris]